MSTHNIGFYEDLTKIIFELSSNISSPGLWEQQRFKQPEYPCSLLPRSDISF